MGTPATPASRSLAAVLRRALEPDAGVRLVVAKIAAADPSGAYCRIELQGVTVRVPMLYGVSDAVGAAAYLLATEDFLLCIGTVHE